MNSKSEWGFNFLPQQVSTAREATKGPETSPRPPEPSPEAPDGRPLPPNQSSQETSFFESQYQRRRKRARIEKDTEARKTQVENSAKTSSKSETSQNLHAHTRKDDASLESKKHQDSNTHKVEEKSDTPRSTETRSLSKGQSTANLRLYFQKLQTLKVNLKPQHAEKIESHKSKRTNCNRDDFGEA